MNSTDINYLNPAQTESSNSIFSYILLVAQWTLHTTM